MRGDDIKANMDKIKFDFNNMFGAGIGGRHGVEKKDIVELQSQINSAHTHIVNLLKDKDTRIRLGLEWVNLPFQDKKIIAGIQRIGKEIALKYENVIFLGIGGSFLGLKAAQDALCPAYYNEFSKERGRHPRIYFEGNNLDPDTLKVLLRNLNPKKTFVVVISKSGETTETKAGFMIIEGWLSKHTGKNYGRQIFVITDPESGSLRKKAGIAQAKDKMSFRSLPLLKGVGGRFSELNMGLLHLAIIGIKIQDILDGAKDMLETCSNADVFKNPAYMYAVLHTILYRKKNKCIAVLMPFSETLKSTGDWYVQLLAESLGKKYGRKINLGQDGKEKWEADKGNIVNIGRTPAAFRGTNDLHSIQQNNIEGENNKAVTFIRVEKFRNELKIPAKGDILSGKKLSDLIKLAQEATEWALVDEERPSCTIVMPEVSAYHWGALLFFFEMATMFEGELLNVNAFDQPGVEGYKNYMYYKLGKPGIPAEIVERIRQKPLVKKTQFIISA